MIFIYTKDCSDTEGYKNQTNFVAQKMAASEVLSAQRINRTLILILTLTLKAETQARPMGQLPQSLNFNGPFLKSIGHWSKLMGQSLFY